MGWEFLSWCRRHEFRIGNLLTILSFFGFSAGLSLLSGTQKEVAYAVSFALLCAGGFIAFLVSSFRLRRKSQYAEVLCHLRASVLAIVEESLHGSHTLEEKKKALVRVMDELSRAFSILTGSSCRTCLKIVCNPSKQSALTVSTFCRNSQEPDAGGDHPIEHNTDFNDLYQDPSKKWFFGNNLPAMAKDGRYNNTSNDWKKKYLATVVWPIRRPGGFPQLPASLLGFLCIDTRKVEAFSEEYDLYCSSRNRNLPS